MNVWFTLFCIEWSEVYENYIRVHCTVVTNPSFLQQNVHVRT